MLPRSSRDVGLATCASRENFHVGMGESWKETKSMPWKGCHNGIGPEGGKS